jgi:hypothetical protein
MSVKAKLHADHVTESDGRNPLRYEALALI